MMKSIISVGLFVVVALSGCSVMSVQECQTANWSQVGERDGASGLDGRVEQYEKACSKGNIQPNANLYQLGYIKGRQHFCQPSVVFHNSLKGSGNYNICPLEDRARLQPYHEVAYEYYQARKAQDDLFDDLERYQTYLLDRDLSRERRDEYRDRVRELRIQQDRIEFNYYEAERKLARFKRDKGL